MLTEEELLRMGYYAIVSTLDCLTIGSDNIHENNLKTACFSVEAIQSVRSDVHWEKTSIDSKSENKDSKAVVWERALNKREEMVSPLERGASLVTRSMENKAGNCEEMSYVALFFLSQHFDANPIAKDALNKGNIHISIVLWPDPYDHVLVRIDMIKEDVIFNSIYIDPWNVKRKELIGTEHIFTSDSFSVKIENMALRLKTEIFHSASFCFTDDLLNIISTIMPTMNELKRQYELSFPHDAKSLEAKSVCEDIYKIYESLDFTKHRNLLIAASTYEVYKIYTLLKVNFMTIKANASESQLKILDDAISELNNISKAHKKELNEIDQQYSSSELKHAITEDSLLSDFTLTSTEDVIEFLKSCALSQTELMKKYYFERKHNSIGAELKALLKNAPDKPTHQVLLNKLRDYKAERKSVHKDKVKLSWIFSDVSSVSDKKIPPIDEDVSPDRNILSDTSSVGEHKPGYKKTK